MNRRSAYVSVACAALLALVVAAPVASAARARAGTLRVGSLALHRCGPHRGSDHGPGWCTKVRRALDPALPHGPRIGIQTQWIPATNGHATGTIVANEGGPGYPSTGSYDEYAGIFGPLERTHNLVLIDNRGTGGSGILRCPQLQSFTGRTSGPRFARIVGACGRSLDHTFKLRDGRWLHASDLYGTAYAVADMAAILRKLHTGRVTMYGDSYGSWLTQAFIARHPRMVNAVILDSTYYLRGLSPWYASSAVAGRRALTRVCTRSRACDRHGGAGAVRRLALILARVRHHSIDGITRLATSKRTRVTITPRGLADLVQDSGSDPVILREEDASVRAALHGDDAPLLRLVAQEQAYNHGTSSAVYFNDALYMAVSCTDYPQLFDMHAPPRVRARQFAEHVARQLSAPFAPFATAEWVSISGYSQPYDVCLDWPSPVHHAPVEPAKRTVAPKSVPILAIGGDVDDLTPLSDVRTFAPTLGRTVRVVALHNTVHATSEGDTFLAVGAACGRSIIDRFAATPARLTHMNVSCAARIPPIRTPGEYPRTFRAIPAGRGAGSGSLRRAAWLATQTAADAAIRYVYAYANGPGLRGGGFTAKSLPSGAVRLTLRGDRFVTDAACSGTVTWNLSTTALHGVVVVHVAGTRYRVRLTSNQRWTDARARVAGVTLRVPNPGP